MSSIEIFAIVLLIITFLFSMFLVYKKKAKLKYDRIKENLTRVQQNITKTEQQQKIEKWGSIARKTPKVVYKIGGEGGVVRPNNRRYKSSYSSTNKTHYTSEDNSVLLSLTDAQRMIVLSEPSYSIHHRNNHDYQVEDSNESFRHNHVTHETTITNDTSPSYDPPSYDSGSSYYSGSSSFSSD